MPRSPLMLSAEERGALRTAQQQSRNVRHWRRYQAVLLRAEGVPVTQVAQSVGCTETSVYNWTAAYRSQGVGGVHEGPHPGAERRLDTAGEAALSTPTQEFPDSPTESCRPVGRLRRAHHG